MRLMKLYYRAGNKLDARASKDFQIEEIRAMLKQLATRGVQFEIVETSTLPDEALMEVYLEAVKSAVLRKYRVRQVFGSQRHPGRLFGRKCLPWSFMRTMCLVMYILMRREVGSSPFGSSWRACCTMGPREQQRGKRRLVWTSVELASAPSA
jgi:hypothetical protein